MEYLWLMRLRKNVVKPIPGLFCLLVLFWLLIDASSGQSGSVDATAESVPSIKVYKKEKKLILITTGRIVKSYPIALCPFNPLADKVKLHDGGTPEGRFYICEALRNPEAKKYGARSLRLSYPNIEDARRGLSDRLIDHAAYLKIVKGIKAGKMPNQNTALGGSIRIHGGGSGQDWTLGCVALDDTDIIELYELVGLGTRVDIFHSQEQEKDLNERADLNQQVLVGAKKQLTNPALYTRAATAIIPLDYPRGDIQADEAVCTDIVIRAFRNAGIDLQAEVHEDIIAHPERYRKLVTQPNYHIDHRRTKNLAAYFSSQARSLPSSRPEDFKPGDIVIMDTGVQNGTPLDHIGIVDDQFSANGYPKVINIWTIGYRTMSMDLLGNQYPTVIQHFRPLPVF